jgi:hypothetical protein
LPFQRYADIAEATCESADLPRGCAGINETRLIPGLRSMHSVLVFVLPYVDVYSSKSTVCGHSPSIGSQHSAKPPYMVTRDEHSTSVPESRRNFIPTERFQIQSIPLGLLSPHIQQRNVVYQQSESAGCVQHCRRLHIPRIFHLLGQPTSLSSSHIKSHCH